MTYLLPLSFDHRLGLLIHSYDKNMPGAPTLEAFETKEMEPHVFQEQLRRAFLMKVRHR
jgi:hypothetical protein